MTTEEYQAIRTGAYCNVTLFTSSRPRILKILRQTGSVKIWYGYKTGDDTQRHSGVFARIVHIKYMRLFGHCIDYNHLSLGVLNEPLADANF